MSSIDLSYKTYAWLRLMGDFMFKPAGMVFRWIKIVILDLFEYDLMLCVLLRLWYELVCVVVNAKPICGLIVMLLF